MHQVWCILDGLYERCTKRCSYSASLFSCENRARALYRRCTEAPYVQRPRQIWGKLIKTTTLCFGLLYICHFDFRSITRVHIQISYLGYSSKRRKISKNSFLLTQTLFHDHQSSSSIIFDHLDVILHGFFIILCLVSFSLISYIFCVFLNKQSQFITCMIFIYLLNTRLRLVFWLFEKLYCDS